MVKKCVEDQMRDSVLKNKEFILEDESRENHVGMDIECLNFTKKFFFSWKTKLHKRCVIHRLFDYKCIENFQTYRNILLYYFIQIYYNIKVISNT